MKPLPREPGPRAGLFQQLDYLQAMAAFLGDAILALLKGQHDLMATVAELQAALDANTAATNAASVAINTEIDQLVAALAVLVPGDPVTQAQLDQLNASTTKLTAAVSALSADDPAPTP